MKDILSLFTNYNSELDYFDFESLIPYDDELKNIDVEVEDYENNNLANVYESMQAK